MAMKSAQQIQLGLLALAGERIPSTEFAEIFADITDSVNPRNYVSREEMEKAVTEKEAEWKGKFVERFTAQPETTTQEEATTHIGSTREDETAGGKPAAPQTYEELFGLLYEKEGTT